MSLALRDLSSKHQVDAAWALAQLGVRCPQVERMIEKMEDVEAFSEQQLLRLASWQPSCALQRSMALRMRQRGCEELDFVRTALGVAWLAAYHGVLAQRLLRAAEAMLRHLGQARDQAAAALVGPAVGNEVCLDLADRLAIEPRIQ